MINFAKVKVVLEIKEAIVNETSQKKLTGYDKYVNYKSFGIAVALFTFILIIPTPASMIDVGIEYSIGPSSVINFFCQQLFGKSRDEVEQWQIMTASILEANMIQ